MRFAVVAVMLMLGAAAPAGAQFAGSWTSVATPPAESRLPGPGTWRDVDDIRDRIDDGRDSATLSRRDARRLSREAGQIDTLAERYGTGGISASEQRELDARAQVLRDQVTIQRSRAVAPSGRR